MHLHFLPKKDQDWGVLAHRLLPRGRSMQQKRRVAQLELGLEEVWNVHRVLGGYGGIDVILQDFRFMNINQYLFFPFLFKYFHLVL